QAVYYQVETPDNKTIRKAKLVFILLHWKFKMPKKRKFLKFLKKRNA
ncbi:unnamed protein product, partial [marine sediment metagenome]